MKSFIPILFAAGAIFLSGCGDTYYFEAVPKPTPKPTPRAPIKYSGGSSTYSSGGPEGFRAVGPSN
jgi:hypothetical protein